MRSVIKNIVFQSMIILLVVQTFNLSINSMDFYTPLNASVMYDDPDYVDSMVEFLVENVMGLSKDTFHDRANSDNTSKQQQNTVHFDLKWFPNALVVNNLEESQTEIVNIIPKNEKFIFLNCKEVLPNPPQLPSV